MKGRRAWGHNGSVTAAALVSAVLLVIATAYVTAWFKATAALGRAVSSSDETALVRSAQNALTPSWLTRRQSIALALVPITFVLSWFGLTWWAAPLVTVGAYVAGVSLAYVGRPRDPLDPHYVRALESDLTDRHRRYQGSGDALRTQAVEDFLRRVRALRGEAQDDTVVQGDEILRTAIAALREYRSGGQANGAQGLVISYMRGYERLPSADPRRKDLVMAATGALCAYDDSPKAQRVAVELKPFPWTELRVEVADALRAEALVTGALEDSAAIRSVGDHSRQSALDHGRLQELLAP